MYPLLKLIITHPHSRKWHGNNNFTPKDSKELTLRPLKEYGTTLKTTLSM